MTLCLKLLFLLQQNRAAAEYMSRLQKAISRWGAVSASKVTHYLTCGQAADDHVSMSQQRLHAGLLA